MKRFICCILCVLSLAAGLFCGCVKPENSAPLLGVWWWDCTLEEKYLDFAKDNGVTEIYYCDGYFNENTAKFIASANANGIKVYWLTGDYRWLREPTPLYNQIEAYSAFCKANPKSAFAGVHLDIEPHQDPNFAAERAGLLKKLITLVHGLSERYADIPFDYDIPFWIDDEIEFGGKVLPAYAHIITYADRAFIMSYRDTAEAIYSTAKDEVEFAQSLGKTVVLGVETYSKEGDNVSFMEEGKEYMYGEISRLRTMIPENYGVCIHHIKTWYKL